MATVLVFKGSMTKLKKGIQIPYTSIELEEVQRSIRMPRYIWEKLDNEATDCGRSSLQQLRQVLLYYFNLKTREIDMQNVKRTQEALSTDKEFYKAG